MPPQPVPERVLQRGVTEPGVLFHLSDGVFGYPATQPVMRFDVDGGSVVDVGDDGMEPVSASSFFNTPDLSHSSRRARKVVSETL